MDSAEAAIAKLLALERQKYELLNKSGALNLQGVLARIQALEQENETLSTLQPERGLDRSNSDNADEDDVVIELPDEDEDGESSVVDSKNQKVSFSNSSTPGAAKSVSSSSSSSSSPTSTTASALNVKTNKPTFSQKSRTADNNVDTEFDSTTTGTHPLSTTGMTPVARKSKTASLPHGFQLPSTADSHSGLHHSGRGSRPASVLIHSSNQAAQVAALNMHPLARANNYNEGSNEVFQAFMYKPKRRSISISTSNNNSIQPSAAGGGITHSNSGSMMSSSNSARMTPTGSSSGGGGGFNDDPLLQRGSIQQQSPRWTKGITFDIRDPNNANLVRSLTSAMSNNGSNSNSNNLNLNLDSIAQQLDASNRTDLAKIFQTQSQSQTQQQQQQQDDATAADESEPDDVMEALGITPNKKRQDSFDSNSSSSLPPTSRTSIFNASSHDLMPFDNSQLQHAASMSSHLSAELSYLLTETQQQTIFEFVSVEADLNYLQALSLNSSLPTYTNSDGVLLGNMSSSAARLNSYFPSRLPSLVANAYPEGAVSSIDAVNSFCFPDGVTVEVHSMHAAEMLTGPQHDQFHILQFTNQNGETSYACCLIVTMASPLNTETLISKACIEMSLQKIAAQRIKRYMRGVVASGKRKRWMQAHPGQTAPAAAGTAGNNNNSSRSVQSRGSVAGAGNNTPTNSKGNVYNQQQPSNVDSNINVARSASTGQSKKRGSVVEDTESGSGAGTDTKSPSFISKMFGGGGRDTSNGGLNTSGHGTAPAPDAELTVITHSNSGNNDSPDVATRKRSQSGSGSQLTSPEQASSLAQPYNQAHVAAQFPILDTATRNKLEGVALALKKAKDAGLSTTCSPAMQMSEALLARHGLMFCDDPTTHYMTPLIGVVSPDLPTVDTDSSDATATKSGPNTPINAMRSNSATSVTSTNTHTSESAASTTSEKKGYSLRNFFGFSGSKKEIKSRPSSTDEYTALNISSPDNVSDTSAHAAEPVRSKWWRPRRPLRERFSTQTPQYLVFQKAYCIVTTLQQLSLIFKLLLAIADAERQFDSITPIGSPSRMARKHATATPLTPTNTHTNTQVSQTTQTQLLSSLLTQSPEHSHNNADGSGGMAQALKRHAHTQQEQAHAQTHNWQIALRVNFLTQAHTALLLKYALGNDDDEEEDSETPSPTSTTSTPKQNQQKSLVNSPQPSKRLNNNSHKHSTGASKKLAEHSKAEVMNKRHKSRKVTTLSTPGYIDRFVIESSLPTTQEWTMAVLLSTITHKNIFQLVNLLMMEKSLVIVGKNVGMVTALAFAVVNLISPFTWEGVFVPLVPQSARELFQAPVPFILGTTTPPRGEDLGTNTAVLYIQEQVAVVCDTGNNSQQHPATAGPRKSHTQASGLTSPKSLHTHPVMEYTTWFTRLPEVSADMPLSETLEREVAAAATFFSTTARDMWVRHFSQPVQQAMRHGVNGSLFANTSNKTPNLNLNSCYLSYMTAKEKRCVHTCLQALYNNNRRYAGDLTDPSAWRRYVKFNQITNEDEFIPNLFMEPMRSVIEFQDAVVQTQLFLGYVDRVRTEYNLLEPYRLFIADWVRFRFHWLHKRRLQIKTALSPSSQQGADDNDGGDVDSGEWEV